MTANSKATEAEDEAASGHLMTSRTVTASSLVDMEICPFKSGSIRKTKQHREGLDRKRLVIVTFKGVITEKEVEEKEPKPNLTSVIIQIRTVMSGELRAYSGTVLHIILM